MNKKQRKERDLDYKRRLQPRLLWNSHDRGTYRRKEHGALKVTKP